MRRLISGGLVFFVGCILILGTADAGWVIHSKDTGSRVEATEEVTYFQRNRIRTDVEGSTHVMDFAAKKILTVDNEKKQYSVMTFEEFRTMVREGMKAARQSMDEMKRRGIPVPGATSGPKGKITVSRISGSTIAGYPCDGYRVSVGGTPREDVWVTKKIDLRGEIDPAAWKEFEDLSREMKKMGMELDEYEESPEYRNVMESGFPMKHVSRDSNYVQEVTRVEKKEIPASLFEEPKGFERVPFDRMTYGLSEETPAAGRGSRGGGETIRPDAAEPREEGKESAPGVGGRATDYGKQSAEEAKDAASRGAQEPVQEKKGEVLDDIREGAREGIKKLFKW